MKAQQQKQKEEPKREKILTFRDMSHLSYFGGHGFGEISGKSNHR
jgi:hypothetical protein